MKKEIIKYKLDYERKTIIKGKLKLYMPNMKGLRKYIKSLPGIMGLTESIFVLNMINFHFLFPADDIFHDKDIKYDELQYMLKQNENSRTVLIKYDDLIYKSLLNNRIFKINMTPEEYADFRIMILNELSEIKNEYNDMFDAELIRLKKQQNIIKRIKLFLKNKDFIELKKKLITETIQNINKDAIIQDNKKAEYKFYEKAYELIEKYDENKYNKLISDVTDYLKKEYEECNQFQEYKEEYEYINSGRNIEEKFEILIWICSNMSPRAEAMDAMRLDASYIYDQVLNNYYREEYRKIRNKMTYEEKRLFQIFFFGRKAFLYKVPVFTKFMKSFYNANSELVFLGLILKKSNPNYKEDNKELKKKWLEFLRIYSIGIKNYSVIESIGNQEKLKSIINKNFREEDTEILNCIMENYSYDIICARFNKNERYVSELVEKLQQAIREESNNEIAKNEN